jgi:hypothetical protein
VAARVRRLRTAAAAGALLLLAACSESPGESPRDDAGDPPAAETSPEKPGHAGHPDAEPGKLLPLRKGEDRLTLTMPAAYTPSAPTGKGTDDYRCFMLDPKLARDSFLTGTNVLPGNPDVVHHVILFRVPPDQIDEAERLDNADQDEGWTCFGGSGVAGEVDQLNDAPWLGAWAPGGSETMTPDGYGVDLPRGSRIIMQVHYNLLADVGPDMSSTQIRVMQKRPDITPLHTFLMPAPVELPCRPGHDASPLCDRDAALADARERFGMVGGALAEGLHYLCGTEPRPSQTSSCTRTLSRPMTVLAAAGHMHLLGRQIRLEVNPDTPDARTVLDIKVWDFDDQGSRPIRPVHLDAGDTVRVTCRHVQWLRDKLPAFEGQEEKYVVWGEGTTDEMCLGLLSVAFE